MRQKGERHSGFHRGQSPVTPRTSEAERTIARAGSNGLTTGSKLKSGITLTFPEDQEPQSGSEGERGRSREYVRTTPQRRDGGVTHRAKGPDQRPPWRDGSAGEPRPGSGRAPRQGRGSKPTLAAQDRSAGPDEDRRKSPIAAGQEATQSLSEKMKEMKILQAEKDMAEEQARQAEAQAQALIEERSRMKAEKEQLERSHNEMAARLQLLEGIISDSDDLEDERPYPHHDGLGPSPDDHFATSVEVLE